MTSLELNGSRFPHRFQNMLIREYCIRLGFKYLYSLTEVSVPDAHLVLKDLVANSEQYDGIAFFSLYMLPNHRDLRESVYDLIEHGKELHFCFEQRTIRCRKDISVIEDILSVRHALTQSPFSGQYRVVHEDDGAMSSFLQIQKNSF